MSWKVNDREFRSVLGLSSDKRYLYFVKHVADWGKLWSLTNLDGWVLYGMQDGTELIPVWPHVLFAQACVINE